MVRQEADILKNLRHPDIPIIYDIEEDTDNIYIVLEYIKGESLKSFISNNKSVSNKDIIMLIVNLCEIVEYLHENGIFHNDIKPDNIIVNNNHIKLIDYGSALKAGQNNTTKTGTFKYAAPELYGEKEIKAGSDIYSIGVVMLFMKTGSVNVSKVPSIHPQVLRTLILKCLNHNEKDRISSIKNLRKELLKLKKNKSVSTATVLINFTGVKHCSGTTHCTLAAAFYFAHSGKKVLVKEKNRSNHFMSIIESCKKSSFHDGIVTIAGIDFLPSYGQYVYGINEDEYEYVLCDYGILTSINQPEVIKGNEICLITGAAPYELTNIGDSQSLLGSNLHLHTLINLADGRMYKEAVRKYCISNPVRVPYIPELYRLHRK